MAVVTSEADKKQDSRMRSQRNLTYALGEDKRGDLGLRCEPQVCDARAELQVHLVRGWGWGCELLSGSDGVSRELLHSITKSHSYALSALRQFRINSAQ